MRSLLLWIWQLPQHTIALIVRRILKPESLEHYKGCKVYWVKQKYVGVSLGQYIFVSTHYQRPTVMHEYGHSVQSLWLGPLYILLISIPSFLFCYTRDRLFHNGWEMEKRIHWYYRQPTEWLADKLGGVDRAKYPYE